MSPRAGWKDRKPGVEWDQKLEGNLFLHLRGCRGIFSMYSTFSPGACKELTKSTHKGEENFKNMSS